MIWNDLKMIEVFICKNLKERKMKELRDFIIFPFFFICKDLKVICIRLS